MKTQSQEDVLLEEEVEISLDSLLSQSLILHNDDFNTIDWVIDSIIDICGYDNHRAEQLTLLVHYKGKANVKKGPFDSLRPLKQQFIDRGINATIDWIN